eukprot:3486906-Rhodomonas_salina.1
MPVRHSPWPETLGHVSTAKEAVHMLLCYDANCSLSFSIQRVLVPSHRLQHSMHRLCPRQEGFRACNIGKLPEWLIST